MKLCDLFESQPRTLYHGTVMRWLPYIQHLGLVPTVGEFVKQVYGPAGIQLEPLVFAADKQGLGKCVSAIIHRLRVDMHMDPITSDEFYKHGLLVILRAGPQQFIPAGQVSDPFAVEPGDWYSREIVQPTAYLTGRKLRAFLRRNGVRLDSYGIADPKIDRAELIRRRLQPRPAG